MKTISKFILLAAALAFIPAVSGCTIADAMKNRGNGGELTEPTVQETEGQESREIIYVLGVTGMD